jgi:DNA polymerase
LVESELAPLATATVHPSSILRAPDAAARQEQMRTFVEDLKRVARLTQRKPKVA